MTGRLDFSLTPGGGLRCLQGRDMQRPVARCEPRWQALGPRLAEELAWPHLVMFRHPVWQSEAQAPSVTLVPTLPCTVCSRTRRRHSSDERGRRWRGRGHWPTLTRPSRLASRRLVVHCPPLALEALTEPRTELGGDLPLTLT